ncbi:E3 ubiquitin-protein ligase MIB2-like [Diadema antillarum]|uniref:E3 ubiquitin-protein ligase MIB2-like n=1 Tax=Diadema antillarum TaxID=105358 RepID=UPI003A8BBCD2
MPLSVGTRVVRGPDWQWDDQDEGEGHVGTVVNVGKGISNPAHPKLVVVLWDMGRKADYRAGFDNKYDLLIFDNATTGVKHNGVICDDCKEADIAGIRWKCSTCNDYDLCTKCYMAGKHDVRHQFLRVIAPKSVGHLMPPRANSKIIRARGMFPGATVGRGLDWKWSEQDGGLGKTGFAVKQRNWANSGRSALVVRWNAGGSYEYRVGHDGKVDLKCLKAADGGPYYKEHLPKFGEENTLEEGDRVVVNLDKGIVQQLQENHGGWVSKMEKYLGKVGKLAHIYPTGDLKIRYSDSQTWTFSPTCVTKLQTFKAGDKVRILSDQSKVKALQVFHGGWAEGMSRAIGKEGRVLFLDADGDVKVNVGGTFWTFNPDCLIPAEQEHGVDGLFEQSGDEAVVQLLKQLLDPLGLVDSEVFRGVTTAALSKMIFEAAAKGDVGEVRELITRDKSLVNVEVQGNRPLDVASYKGHLAVVDLLVRNGAKLDVKDKDGDTALCNAVYQNETKIVEYLLKKGANSNIANNSMRSALHIAVAKNGTDCVKLLLQYGCNPNLKDKVGDTALHDAIRKKANDIIELLISAKKGDLTVTNKKGFNPLHFAARLDNAFATRKILAKKRSLVDIRKEDGYSALHLAALNDHRNIVQILVTEGQCAIDLYNDEHQTALVLAILHGHPLVVEDLVDHGADVNTCDGDGDTCLHLAIMKHRQGQGVPDTQALRKFRHKYRDNGITTPLTALMCYLVQQGADVEKTNLKKRTPLSYLKEVAIRKVLEHIARKRERPESGDSSMLEVGKAAGAGGGGDDQFGNQTGEGLPQSPVQPSHGESFTGVHKIEDPDKDLEQGEVIGRGGFGEVRKGRWRGTEVAIKIMCSEGSRQDVVESEVSIHKRAIHPNIVQLMAVGHKLNQAVLVMQLIRGKNLMEVIFEDGNPLSFEQRVRVSSELLSAVTYLHHCKILHLDIKPGNVILETATSRPYLCDLGLAHIKTRSAMSSTVIGARGTRSYMPPEAIITDERGNMKVTSASDVWSLACTLLELFTSKPLWPDMTPMGLIFKFMSDDVTPSEVKGKNLDDRVKAIISPCFKKDPTERPTVDIMMQGFSGLG